MANGKRATARKSASARNTGVRKTRKKNDENIPAAAAPPRPKPRPRVKKAAAGDIGDAVTSADRDDAAAATILISMAAPRGGEIDASNVDDDLQLIDASKDYSVEESDLEVASDEEPDFSEEDQEASDEDVDRIIEKYNPKINVPAVFSLPFEVPYKNGTCDLTGLTSKSSFDEFLLAAASKMETRITMLSSIGYVPSYKKPKPQPKLLDDEDAWEVLVSDVRQHIKGAQSKNRGKGQVQPFSILISDMSESSSEPSKGGKKGVKKSKSNEDSLETAGPAVKEHELFKQIETKHYCQSCKAPCVVLDSGDRHILTNTELATWALLLSRHQAVIGEAPKELNLEIGHARQQRAKNHRGKAVASPDDSPLGWIQALAPVLGAFINNRPPPSPSPAEWQQLQHHIDPHTPVLHLNRSHIPSVLGKRSTEDITTCPDIASWLGELDSDPVRGRMKINYSQYTDLLRENGFFELSDVANLSAKQLLAMIFLPFATKRPKAD
ncbi:hypothetical protein B0H14DRAFT_3152810 [Mycena olivaceomarginata]|nr:hypothetical protein B0H14DRAFT_3152810 [Mycena olivaceomarginata]